MHRRTPRRHFWIAIVGSASLGCGPDARAVFDQMHQAACSGDADKFFVHVDEDKLVANTMKHFEGATSPDILSVTDPSGAEFLRRTGARAGLDDWRKDINERGKDGDVCGWTLLSAEKIGDNQRVEARSKAGNKKLLYYARSDGGLKLVEFRALSGMVGSAPDGDGSASSIPSIASSTVPSALNAMGVCHRLEAVAVAADCKVSERSSGGGTVEFSIPSVRTKQGTAGGIVMQARSDTEYGFWLGYCVGQRIKHFGSAKTRVVVELLLSDAFPPNVEAKTKDVVDGLAAETE